VSTPRLKDLYVKEIQPSLKSKFGFKNLYMGPKIEKIIVKAALDKANGKKNEAAILLGLGRNTLAKKMKELGL